MFRSNKNGKSLFMVHIRIWLFQFQQNYLARKQGDDVGYLKILWKIGVYSCLLIQWIRNFVGTYLTWFNFLWGFESLSKEKEKKKYNLVMNHKKDSDKASDLPFSQNI